MKVKEVVEVIETIDRIDEELDHSVKPVEEVKLNPDQVGEILGLLKMLKEILEEQDVQI